MNIKGEKSGKKILEKMNRKDERRETNIKNEGKVIKKSDYLINNC